eukprot:2714755-Pyramimonas_sp.AAC.1
MLSPGRVFSRSGLGSRFGAAEHRHQVDRRDDRLTAEQAARRLGAALTARLNPRAQVRRQHPRARRGLA